MKKPKRETIIYWLQLDTAMSENRRIERMVEPGVALSKAEAKAAWKAADTLQVVT